MYQLLLSFLFLLLISCNSAEINEKEKSPQQRETENSAKQKEEVIFNGKPSKDEARIILQEWFDEFKSSVGGYNYEAKNFEVLSVAGNAERAEINFQWTGTFHSASLPGSDNSSNKVTDEKKTLVIQKQSGKWQVKEILAFKN